MEAAGDGSKATDHQQETRDDEGKDPLQGKCLGEQLAQTQSKRQHTGTETHSVVIECNQEESRNEEEQPDQNVRQDTAHKLVHVEQHSSVPEDGVEQP